MVTIEEMQEWFTFFIDIGKRIEPVYQWVQENWVTVALTGEIIGAVIAVRMGAYRRGIGWLIAAVATLWLGWKP